MGNCEKRSLAGIGAGPLFDEHMHAGCHHGVVDDDDHPDLDDLTRTELAEREGPGYAVACILDEWKQRLHGLTSSDHGAGLFLDLLAEQGWRVERIDAPVRFATSGPPIRVNYLSGVSDDELRQAKESVVAAVVEVLNEQRPAASE